MDIILIFIVLDFIFECLFDKFKKTDFFQKNQEKLYVKFITYIVNNYKEQIVSFIVIYIIKSNSVTKFLADFVALITNLWQ